MWYQGLADMEFAGLGNLACEFTWYQRFLEGFIAHRGHGVWSMGGGQGFSLGGGVAGYTCRLYLRTAFARNPLWGTITPI